MHSLISYITAFGYVGVTLVIFAESGFFLGFFLPGDSLVFTVGILAAQGYFNVWIMLGLGITAAILGDSFGYYMGKHFGVKLFERKDSWLFKHEYVERTEAYFAKYGPKTIIMARFIPIVRTFAPILAGIGSMKYRTFLTYNIVGGIVWITGFLLAGYYLGKKFSGIDHYLTYIVMAIIVISVIPIVIDYIRARNARKQNK